MVGFCDNIALSLNFCIRTAVIYFDFAKAFDSVNPDLILKNLKFLFLESINLTKIRLITSLAGSLINIPSRIYLFSLMGSVPYNFINVTLNHLQNKVCIILILIKMCIYIAR